MSRREQSEVGVEVKAVLDKAVRSHPRWKPKSCGQGWALHVLRDSRPRARTQTPLSKAQSCPRQSPSSEASVAARSCAGAARSVSGSLGGVVSPDLSAPFCKMGTPHAGGRPCHLHCASGLAPLESGKYSGISHSSVISQGCHHTREPRETRWALEGPPGRSPS